MPTCKYSRSSIYNENCTYLCALRSSFLLWSCGPNDERLLVSIFSAHCHSMGAVSVFESTTLLVPAETATPIGQHPPCRHCLGRYTCIRRHSAWTSAFFILSLKARQCLRGSLTNIPLLRNEKKLFNGSRVPFL